MATQNVAFETVTALDLDAMPASVRDALPFGVVGIDRHGITEIYNATEARMAGLDPASVVGVPFFTAIAQCMNNYMVAQRFEDERALDAIIPYVLTLRMRPTPVQLRLLSTPDAARRYVLIQR